MTPTRAAPAQAPPRPGSSSLASLSALYTLTLRQHFNGKRWMVLGALFLTPAVLAAIVRATAPDVPPRMLEFLFAFMLIPQALLPLVALLYGSGVIQDEQEEQTLTYLLIRPIPKWAIYVVKVLATLTTTVALTAVFTALTYVVIYTGADAGGDNIALRCFEAVRIHALTVVAYCCLFAFLSLLTKRALVLGFLYAAIVEGLLANLPFSVRLLTVIYYARLIAYRTLSFEVVDPRGRTLNLAAEAWQFDVRNDPSLLEHPALGTCVAVLVIASLVCTALGAYLCSRREFYVKTPDGG